MAGWRGWPAWLLTGVAGRCGCWLAWLAVVAAGWRGCRCGCGLAWLPLWLRAGMAAVVAAGCGCRCGCGLAWLAVVAAGWRGCGCRGTLLHVSTLGRCAVTICRKRNLPRTLCIDAWCQPFHHFLATAVHCPPQAEVDREAREAAQSGRERGAVYLHCWGGKGRSGTVGAAVLSLLFPRATEAEVLARLRYTGRPSGAEGWGTGAGGGLCVGPFLCFPGALFARPADPPPPPPPTHTHTRAAFATRGLPGDTPETDDQRAVLSAFIAEVRLAELAAATKASAAEATARPAPELVPPPTEESSASPALRATSRTARAGGGAKGRTQQSRD